MEKFLVEVFQNHEIPIFIDKYGFPFFVGAVVSSVFDYTTNESMYELIPDEYKVAFEDLELDKEVKDMADPVKIKPNSIFLSEEGLYFVAFTSRKSIAEDFRKWIASDLLLVLRRTGKYKMKERFIFKDQRLIELSTELEKNVLSLTESNNQIAKLTKKIKKLYIEILYHRKHINNLIIAKGYIYARKVPSTLFAKKEEAYKIGLASDLDLRDTNYKVGGMNAPLVLYYPIDDLDLKVLENVIKANLASHALKFGTETFFKMELLTLMYVIKSAIKSQRKLLKLEPKPIESVIIPCELDREFDKKVAADEKIDAVLTIITNLVDIETPIFSMYLKKMTKEEGGKYKPEKKKVKLTKVKNMGIVDGEKLRVENLVRLYNKYNIIDIVEIQVQDNSSLQKDLKKRETKINKEIKKTKIPVYTNKRVVLLTLAPFFGQAQKYLYEEDSEIDKFVKNERVEFQNDSKNLEAVLVKLKPYLVNSSYFSILNYRNDIVTHGVITTVDETKPFEYNSDI